MDLSDTNVSLATIPNQSTDASATLEDKNMLESALNEPSDSEARISRIIKLLDR